MSKNKKLEERTRALFIKAAMDILKSEGIQCISARNVADSAGYSYATLYNYFKDMNSLVFECMEEFRSECFDFIGTALSSHRDEKGLIRIKSKLKSLSMYFVQYPGIFDLFYLEKMTNAGEHRDRSSAITSLIPDLLKEELEDFFVEKKLEPPAQERMTDHLLYTVSGLLLFFMNRYYPGNYNEMLEKLDQQIDIIFADQNQAV